MDQSFERPFKLVVDTGMTIGISNGKTVFASQVRWPCAYRSNPKEQGDFCYLACLPWSSLPMCWNEFASVEHDIARSTSQASRPLRPL